MGSEMCIRDRYLCPLSFRNLWREVEWLRFLFLCPMMETCPVSCSLAAMSTRVDFYSGAAWSAMPSVATRPISVVDVCSRHTLHGSW